MFVAIVHSGYKLKNVGNESENKVEQWWCAMVNG